MRFTSQKLKNNFLILSWALYDLANQFFALNVVSLYFVRWLTLEKKSPEIFYSLSFGISMFGVAIFAPVLGTISDMKRRYKPFLVYLTLLAIIFTMLLSFTQNIFLALLFFAIANFGCQEAIIFYNTLMLNIAPRSRIGLVSGLGKMFGYIGAILALLFTKPIILEKGYQATFLVTGILFLIFSLPCMIFIKEKNTKEKIMTTRFFKKEKLREIFRRVKATLSDSYQFGNLWNFLKAAFFGLCVVNVVILFMSVYATKVFGLAEAQIINLIIFSTFFAIGGSIVSGFISDYIGYKRSMVGVFILWMLCLLGGGILEFPFYYWVIGAMVGISLGSTWVVSRALVIKLVPEEKIGEIFGIFNLVGYVSAIAGPLFWGLILLFLGSWGKVGYRLSLLSLNLFMVVGLVFLLRIPEPKRN
jgi:UMF1 family MFS transporter